MKLGFRQPGGKPHVLDEPLRRLRIARKRRRVEEMTGVQHWQDSDGKWWHAINQGGKGHPADPAHKFQVVDMPCDCVRPEDDRP